jgi:molecular chaperone DnaK (HSP70)
VFDLGGGTLDVSIVDSSEAGRHIEIKAVDGDPLLGGRDFDKVSVIMQHKRAISPNYFN